MADELGDRLARLPVAWPSVYPTPPSDAPVTQSYADFLQRRDIPDTDAAAAYAAATDQSFERSQHDAPFAGLNYGARNFAASFPALYGAGANLVAPGAGDSALDTAIGMQRRAQAFKPTVDELGDVHGVGDAAAYARNKILEAAPDLALMAGTGAIGGGIARAAARRATEGALEKALAINTAKAGLESATPKVLDAATRSAALAEQGVKDSLAAEAGKTAVGRAAGVVAGMYPGTVGGDAENLKGASREDTAKLLAGDLGVAAVGALPEIRFFGKLFGPAEAKVAAENAQKFLPRLAKETGIQAGLGGAAGVAQTAAQLGVHKWVNDNVDLLSPQSLAQYMESGVAGATLGAVMGGGLEAAKAVPFKAIGGKIADVVGEAAQKSRDAFDAAKTKVGASESFQAAKAVFDKNSDALKGTLASLKGEVPPLKSESLAYPPERDRNPYELPSKAQNMVGRFIPTDSPLWHPDNVSKLDQLTKSAARALKDKKLSTQDNVNLTELANHVDGGLDTIELWKKAGKTAFATAQNHVEEEAQSAGDETPPKNNAMDALDTLTATPETAKEHPDALTAAKQQLKVDFYDGKQGSQTGQSNVITQRPDRQAFFDEKAASPETVELAGGFKYGNKQMPRRALFEIGNLVSNELQRTPGLTLRGAYDTALSNLRLLGYEIDPASIKAGTIWKDKNNAENKLELSPTDVDAIRAGYEKPAAGSVKANSLEATRAASAERAGRIDSLGAAFTAAHQAEAGAAAHAHDLLMKDPAVVALLKAQDAVKARTGSTSDKIDAKLTKRASELLDADPTMQGHKATLAEARAKVQELAPHLYEQKGEARATEFNEKPADEHMAIEDTRQDSPVLGEREPPPINRASSSDPYRGYFASKDGTTSTKAGAAIAKVRALRDELIHETLGSNDPSVKALLKRIDTVLPKQSAAPTEGEVPAAKRSRMEILNDLAPALKELRGIADEIGGKIGKAELERQIQTHPDAPQEFQKQLEDLPNKTHEWFKRGAAGEFARAQISEMAPDFNKLKPLNDVVNEAKTRFEKAQEVLDKNPDSKFAKAEHEAAQRDLAEAEAARDDAKLGKRKEDNVPLPEPGAEGSSGGVETTTTAKAKPDGLAALREAGAARKAPKAEQAPTKTKPVPETRVEGKPVKGMEGKLERGTLKSESLTPAETIAKSSPKDHAKLEKIANDLLARLGIKEKVTVERHAHASERGDYTPGSGRIRINDSVTGARRVEVLAHELGHHIKINALAKASPEVRAAISKDYQDWIDSSGALEKGASVKGIERSRNPFNIANDKAGLDRSVGSLSPEESRYLTSFDEYVADHIARALTHSDKTPVGKFFSGLVDTLKKAYKMLFGEKGGKDYAPAPSVEKWINSLYDPQVRDASQVLGHSAPKDVAESMTHAAVASEHAGSNEAPPPSPAGGGLSPPPVGGGASPSMVPPTRGMMKNLFNFIRYSLGDKNREILARKTDNPNVLKRLGELFPQYKKDLMSASRGLETRVALAYLAHKDGQLNFGSTTRSMLTNIRDDLHAFFHIAKDSDYAMRAFNDMAAQRVEQMRKSQQTPLRDAKAYEDRRRGAQQKIYNDTVKAANTVTAPFRGLFESSIGRMRATANPAIRDIASKLHLHTGESGKDPGYISAVTHTTDLKSRQWSDIINSSHPVDVKHALAHMQRQTPDDQAISAPVKAVVDKMRKFFADSANYIKEVKPDFPEKSGFYPVIPDLKNEADEGTLRGLLDQPHFEQYVRAATDGKIPDSPNGTPPTMDQRLDYMVRRAKSASPSQRGIDDQDTMTKGVFKSEFKRTLDFIYEHGTQADKETFAKLQSNDPNQITSRYIIPMVKRVESMRRFGDKDVTLEKSIKDAIKQGASPEQITQARNAVAGARGEVGLDGSPVLKKFLGESLANKIANPTSKRGIQALQAYQNVRVLPLVTLSSLVDPMGIAVRTGSFKNAWDGFKVGIKSLYDKSTREEMLAHLRMLGSADDFYTNGIVSDRYGGGGSDNTRKFNEGVFKAYGLYHWVRATRYMALQAAHGFLLNHAAMDNPKSERYLSHELNLKAGDVQPGANGRVKVLSDEERAAATKPELARDDRVRQALLRVVDESILRPNPQMSPNWHSDPYMGLVSQYKSFAYAMHDQIGKRIWHEIQHGNPAILGPALSYVPIIIASEMLRGFLQYGPGGNPNRDDWGPGDWTNYALLRAGYAKPSTTFATEAASDRAHHAFAGSTLLGPSFQQAKEVLKTASGDEPVGTAALHAAPGEALFGHWGGRSAPSGGVPRRGLSYGSP